MIPIWKLAAGGGLAALGALYLTNASWLAPVAEDGPYYIAHRGVHQAVTADAIGRDDCTAAMIAPPEHSLLENTLPSIRAAFEAGARHVEIDIHPTTDGDFAVFHDWTLDCRTNGSGTVRQRSMAYIRTLDAGWGYTADGGETFPLRGAVGAIPSLEAVLRAFPDGRFVINFKSDDPAEGDALAQYLDARELGTEGLIVYGGPRPVARFTAHHPDVPGFDRGRLKQCATGYLAWGWSGHVPAACRETVLLVPRSHAWLLWGWPARFEQRMHAVGTQVWVMGDWDGQRSYSTGLDTPAERDSLPDRFRGGIWTNRIEWIGPGADAPTGDAG